MLLRLWNQIVKCPVLLNYIWYPSNSKICLKLVSDFVFFTPLLRLLSIESLVVYGIQCISVLSATKRKCIFITHTTTMDLTEKVLVKSAWAMHFDVAVWRNFIVKNIINRDSCLHAMLYAVLKMESWTMSCVSTDALPLLLLTSSIDWLFCNLWFNGLNLLTLNEKTISSIQWMSWVFGWCHSLLSAAQQLTVISVLPVLLAKRTFSFLPCLFLLVLNAWPPITQHALNSW